MPELNINGKSIQGTVTGRVSGTVPNQSNVPKNADGEFRGVETGRISSKEPALSNTPQRGEVGMSRYRAEAYLRRMGASEVIATVYDYDEMLRGALIATIPNFEYPDWSYQTIGAVLAKFYPKAKL